MGRNERPSPGSTIDCYKLIIPTPRSSVSEKHGEVGLGIHKKIKVDNLPQEVLEPA
jgi:hypothetical protein